MTPAMASEPYCAEAPSRSTSMRLMALTGMALRSVPAVPRPTEVLTWMRALPWRRLPFTSTSTWSGPKPRSVAGRTESVPSLMVELEKLKEGISAWMIRPTSLCPVSRISCSVTTSTGTGESVMLLPSARVPTPTTTSSCN